MKTIIKRIIIPTKFNSIITNIGIAIPRILGGLSLSFEFGSSKFGMPWSANDEFGLFEVAKWFPEDIEKFGAPFSAAPLLFAWLAAATEAIGGLFLALGLGTRITAFFIACTMLVAIFL